MKLVHFSAEPLVELYPVAQAQTPAMKPKGFWVSDEDAETSWTAWCRDESFALDRLTVASDVRLVDDHNVLILEDATAIDRFNATYGVELHELSGYIDWVAVAREYAGIIITPYQWSRRMTRHTFWYYTWDCASGCIWDTTAIASFAATDSVGAA